MLAIFALVVRQAIPGFGIPFWFFQQESPKVETVRGPLPWTVDNHGYRYLVESAIRTPHEGSQPSSSITITGFVTVTQGSSFSHVEFQIHDQANNLLQQVGSRYIDNPQLNQRERLVLVVLAPDSQAQSLTINVQDIVPGGPNFTLRGVPVS